MKKCIKLISLLLSAMFCFSLIACGADGKATSGSSPESSSPESPGSSPAESGYKVTVLDYTGAPYRDVIVCLYKGDEQLKMTVVDENGTAAFDFDDGDYTFTVMTTDNNTNAYYYDKESCVLTADAKEATVTLYKKAVLGEKVYVGASDDGFDTYSLTPGCSVVSLNSGMNYFVFFPTESGVYNFSCNTGSIGYYGNPISAMTVNLAEINEDGSIDLNIKDGMIGGAYLFGVEAEAAVEGALFTVKRTGNPILSWEDRPWTAYLPIDSLAKFTLDEEITLKNIDVTDPSVSVVYNESDGYYHYGSENGPLVYVRISSAGEYLSSFTDVCDKTRMGAYIKDESGETVRKESYNELIAVYAAACDEASGVIPLDRNMEYVIKSVGEYWGWWDISSGRYLFTGKIINKPTAWLFACCYAN